MVKLEGIQKNRYSLEDHVHDLFICLFTFFNWNIPILCKAERVEQMFTICFHISEETSRNANKTS